MSAVVVRRQVTATSTQSLSVIGQNHWGRRMKNIIGPQSLASVYVKPATIETEIPVLNTRGQHRYNGNCSRAEFLGDDRRDVQFVCLQIPVESRTPIGARESTVFGFPNAHALTIAIEQTTGSIKTQ